MISVFVPAHITGFFSIFDNENPLEKGSLGAGVLLNKGVITKIDYNNSNNGLVIKINNELDNHNQVIILKTIEIMENDLKSKNIFFDLTNICLNQSIEVPIGCGFGTSAASAIGTAVCINEFFELGLSIQECGKYAHLAEVELGSGLGDVIAELSKGLVVRTKAGAPGVGEIKSLVPHKRDRFGVLLNEESDFYVITKSLGKLQTSSIINDEKHKKIITNVGLTIGDEFDEKDDGVILGPKFKSKFGVAVDSKFDEEETIKKFMNASLNFAKKTHLINNDLLNIVHLLHGKVLGSSMAMLGNTIFALANENQKLKLEAEYYGEFDFYKLETKGISIYKY